MSMPKIPEINSDLTRKRAIDSIIMSISMEEMAIAHILNAEGEKLQYVLGTLEEKDPGEITLCDIMAVNKSIQETLREARKAERLLQFKLEDVRELDKNGDEE